MLEDKNKTISEDLKDLVVARLDIMSPDLRISIGSAGIFSKNELIDHVKKGDEVGRKIIELEMNFLMALKDGTLLEELITDKSDN